MPQQHVFDDGEAQPGPADFPGPALVDAVKAFRQTRDVRRRDTDTIVADREDRFAVRAEAPLDLHGPAGGGIAHGVEHQVRKRTVQLIEAAEQEQRLVLLLVVLQFLKEKLP